MPKVSTAAARFIHGRAKIVRALLAVVGVATLSDGALSDDEQFYARKTVSLVVGGAAGTSYDAYARVLARHIGRFIPGNPGIIVQNMPGAGSSKAAEYMFLQAPKDGTTFALLFPGALMEPLLEPEKFRYDPTRFEYLGTLDQDTRSCMTSAKSKVKTFEDARQHVAIMAGTQRGSSTVDYPLMLNALAGTKFKVVSGYKSTNETLVAVERGEADGMCSNLSVFISQKPEWLGPPDAQMLVQLGLASHPAMARRNVPTVWGFIPEENKPVVELIVAQQVFGRPFALPPGTPSAQVATLRAAFMTTAGDQAFAEELRMTKLDLNPLPGTEVAALIKRVFAAPKEVIARMSAALTATDR